MRGVVGRDGVSGDSGGRNRRIVVVGTSTDTCFETTTWDPSYTATSQTTVRH